MRFRSTLLALLCIFLPPREVHAQPKQESFYTQAIRGVVRLEHHEDIKLEGQDSVVRTIRPDGTGFFIHTSDSLFIVTAAHVARQNYDLHARVPVKQESGDKIEVWELRLPRSEWVFHPMKGDVKTHPVDVATMKIPSIKDWGTIAFRYCVKTCPEGQYNQLERDDIEPPDQVIVFGFPLDVGLILKEPRPMGRQGIVALRTNEEFIEIEKNILKVELSS